MNKGYIFTFILSLTFLVLLSSEGLAANLSPGGRLFSPQDQLQGGGTSSSPPDQYHEPHMRHQPNQVPEKLDFIFQGHQGMGSMGGHYLSDVQWLLSEMEQVNQGAWNDIHSKFSSEFNAYSGNGTLAMRASVPAGAMAVAALDNAGGVAEKNFEFGVRFLFEGLGNQQGSNCDGTVRGMLEGDCRWGTPPVIESQVFANVIGDDVNLSQLNGDYEVWGVAPARATLINLIFNQGLFQ